MACALHVEELIPALTPAGPIRVATFDNKFPQEAKKSNRLNILRFKLTQNMKLVIMKRQPRMEMTDMVLSTVSKAVIWEMLRVG